MRKFSAVRRVFSSPLQVMTSVIKPGVMLRKAKSEPAIYFYAVADFKPDDKMRGALPLRRGDEVRVLKRDPSGWWCVAVNKETGWAPSTFLDPCSDMYTVLEDTGEPSTDFQNDKAQPFGGKEEDENGYLTLGRNARPVCVDNTYITLEREDVAVKGLADVHNANEADDEGLYLEVESRNMGMVNKADVETDDEGYMKITTLPLPAPGSAARHATSTGSSVDNSCSPSPADSPVDENLPTFPPDTKRKEDEQLNVPAIPPRRLPRQPLNKMQSRERIFQIGPPKGTHMEEQQQLTACKMKKGKSDAHVSPRKLLLRTSTDTQLLDPCHAAFIPVKPMRIDEVKEPDTPEKLAAEKFREDQIRLSAEPIPPPRPNKRRCPSDETPLPPTHVQGNLVQLRPESPKSKNGSHYLSTLGNMPWFHGKLSRQKAQSRLLKDDVEVGDFLVRESESQPGSYTMSVRNITSECLHFMITVLAGGERFAMENALFSSIEKIIEFYQTQDIFETDCKRLRLNKAVTKRTMSKNC